MKKSLITVLISIALTIGGMLPVIAQEQPEPQKDSVNMDTEAKPTQYYDVEDDKSEAGGKSKSSPFLTIGIVCAVLVVGSVVYFISKKKKK